MQIDLTIDAPVHLATDCARRFERTAAAAISDRGYFACAVPGGSVADACFPSLAVARVDWPRTHVFWGDERAVPPADPQSNYGLAWRLWLRHVDVAAEHVHRMPADDDDLERAAGAYEAELRRTLGDLPRLDLVLLGVGSDGHICSLFPGHAALDEQTRHVAAVFGAPKPPARRLTLTLPILAAARAIVVCAFGRDKADAIHQAVNMEMGESPLARATRDHPNVAWLLDADAASRLA